MLLRPPTCAMTVSDTSGVNTYSKVVSEPPITASPIRAVERF
jgi:hypothetical protein